MGRSINRRTNRPMGLGLPTLTITPASECCQLTDRPVRPRRMESPVLEGILGSFKYRGDTAGYDRRPHLSEAHQDLRLDHPRVGDDPGPCPPGRGGPEAAAPAPLCHRKPEGYRVTAPGDLISRSDVSRAFRNALSFAALLLEYMERKFPFRFRAIQIDGGSEFKQHF